MFRNYYESSQTFGESKYIIILAGYFAEIAEEDF